jgi:hypothetical protein
MNETGAPTLADELAELRSQVTSLRTENARLLRLLSLTPQQAAPPGPVQTGFLEASQGPVHAGSAPEMKVALPTSTPRGGRTPAAEGRVVTGSAVSGKAGNLNLHSPV